jgi:hypothetical protein
MEQSNGWRPLVAVLANPRTRRAAARIMLGDDLDAATEELSPSTRRAVRKALVQSGLVDPATGLLVPEAFSSVLEAAPVARREGIHRFLDGTRIRQYPAGAQERRELLAWVARDAFAVDEVLTESEVNQRLLPYSEDVAVLRRYLVDHGLIERRADGSEYARAVGGDGTAAP